jgi:hypothetical protein
MTVRGTLLLSLFLVGIIQSMWCLEISPSEFTWNSEYPSRITLGRGREEGGRTMRQ